MKKCLKWFWFRGQPVLILYFANNQTGPESGGEAVRATHSSEHPQSQARSFTIFIFSSSFNDVFMWFFGPDFLPVLFQKVPSNHANSFSPLPFLFPINQYSKIWLIKSIIQLIIDHFVVGSSLQPCQEFFSTCSPESPHLPCWLLIGDRHQCVCIFYLYLYLVSTLCCHTGKGTSGHIGMESSE